MPLHALGRYNPGLVEQIKLGPPRPYRLARARARQNGELQRAGRNALLLRQGSHEGRKLGVGQRRMMYDAPHLRTRWQ